MATYYRAYAKPPVYTIIDLSDGYDKRTINNLLENAGAVVRLKFSKAGNREYGVGQPLLYGGMYSDTPLVKKYLVIEGKTVQQVDNVDNYVAIDDDEWLERCKRAAEFSEEN